MMLKIFSPLIENTMNIFFLSILVTECALLHCDKHVVKMILESAQLLWSAWHMTGDANWQYNVPSNIKIYRLTHKNHPMSIWVRKSTYNYWWLVRMAVELCIEYDRRYRCTHSSPRVYNCNICKPKRHACMDGLVWLLNNIPQCNDDLSQYNKSEDGFATKNIPPGCTKVPLCMPIEYYSSDLTEAYRSYYRGDKRSIATWINTMIPKWYHKVKIVNHTVRNII